MEPSHRKTKSDPACISASNPRRAQFKAAIVGYLLDIQANNGIQKFDAEDVEVLAGESMDAIAVHIAISVVDSVEKIYITLEVS